MNYWESEISLSDLVKKGIVSLGRGRIISSIDLQKNPGIFPVYSSSSQKGGLFGLYNEFDFNEELLTWSVDGGGYFFYRPKHKFSVTNVSGILKVNEPIYDYKFLYYSLVYQHSKEVFDYVDKAHPSVIKKRYSLPTISLNEQKKIASILSKVDEAIENTEKLFQKYENVKIGLMQDLLTKGIDENGNIRSEENHQFKDSPLGRIPVEWDCDRLDNYCELIKDGTHFSPKTIENGEYLYITSKNIRMGYIDLSNVQFVSKNDHLEIYKHCPIKFNDVLLTKDGANTGNICLNTIKEEFSLLSSVALIRGKKDVLLNDFIVKFFTDVIGQRTLVDQMSGNAITRITLVKIKNTLIKRPPYKEQKIIINYLERIDSQLNVLKSDMIKTENKKQGLMQDLLSGKVRVND